MNVSVIPIGNSKVSLEPLRKLENLQEDLA